MISLGLIASLTAAIAFLCLLINLATFALPVWVAGSVFFYIERSNEGLIGAGIIGLLSGLAAHLCGRFACARAPSGSVAALIALIFAMPACFAGYHLGAGLGRLIFMTPLLQQIVAFSFAVLIFILCWRRIAHKGSRRPYHYSDTYRSHQQPLIDAAFCEVDEEQPSFRSHNFSQERLRVSPPRTFMLD
jgi:hypothetical protein